MKLADFKLLKKLLNMTLSGADQERLTAIDKANEIVAKSNTTWDRVLDRVIKVEVEVESREVEFGRDAASAAALRAARKKRIDDAFEVLLAGDPRGDFADFVADVKATWDRKGSISPAQEEAIVAAARRRNKYENF